MTFAKLKKLKPNTKLKVSKRYMRYWLNNALADCGGPSFRDESLAQDWFIRKAVAMGLPYTINLVIYRNDVGDGPGALVQIQVGDFIDRCYIGHKDLEPIK